MHKIGSFFRLGEITGQQLFRFEAIWGNQPADAARRHTGDAPFDSVAVGEFLPFAPQECHEGRAYSAQADNA